MNDYDMRDSTPTPSMSLMNKYYPVTTDINHTFITAAENFSSAYYDDDNTTTMGPRTNRKRIRHRPSLARRPLPPWQYPTSGPNTSLPRTPGGRWTAATAYTDTLRDLTSTDLTMSTAKKLSDSGIWPRVSTSTTTTTTAIQPLCTAAHEECPEESDASRDRRIFGGEDDDTQSARDLRGPMLDVVLGLFNGVDYDGVLGYG